MIKLAENTISNSDIDKLIEWLKTYPKLTKDKLTKEFETKWSKYLGCKYSVFVNSGSSANLLMVYTLIQMGKIKIGDNVIVPSLSWVTSLTPFIQFGLNPILCDCNLDDLSIDLENFEELCKQHKPKVLMLVPILGFVPNMNKVQEICKKYNVILLEDACESLGSEYRNIKLGNFGLMSSFSTYFGHHISTIEGGIICTNDKEVYDILISLRSHGWDRDLDIESQKQHREKYKTGEFNALYTFYYDGFNLRSTDLQAFIGLGQLEKLDSIVKKRNENYRIYFDNLNDGYWKPKNPEYAFISNFAYPIIAENKRSDIVNKLNEKNIENRPLLSGSLGMQPFWKNKFGENNFSNCDIIHNHGMYLPNHYDLNSDQILEIVDIINSI